MSRPHKFTKAQLGQIERQTCNKHPGRTFKYKPKNSKTFPNGCPVCLKIWDDKQEEKEAERAKVREANRKKAAPLLKYREENPDFAKNNPGNFKKGESGMDRKKKKDIHEYVKDKTVGGNKIIDKLLAIAGLHPRKEMNEQGVSHQQQMAAIKELMNRGFGPVVDPDAKEEQNKGIVVNVLSLENTTFEDYQNMVAGKIPMQVKTISGVPEREKDDE